MWVQLAWMLISYVVSVATAPKPKNAKPASLSDFDFPQIEEGTPEQWIFGDCWIEDWMVVGVGNFRTQAIKSKSGK